MNVHLVQFDISWEQKESNFERVRRLLNGADIASGSLLVLPEMFSTGFSMNVAATSQGREREAEVFLAELAKQYECTVLGGVVSVENGQPFNQAVAMAPDGSCLVRYDKMQPFSPGEEDRHYGAGEDVKVFPCGGFTVAPFICYDLRFPEHFRKAALNGADLKVVIASWPAKRQSHWRLLLQARAIENQAYVLGVNRCGKDPGHEYAGGSLVIDPQGDIIVEADDREQVLSVSITTETVKEWRSLFPALKDMR